MKVKMKLEEVNDKRRINSEGWTFTFEPTLDELKKQISLKISTADPQETMGKLGLPQSVGDTIILQMDKKGEQNKLGEK